MAEATRAQLALEAIDAEKILAEHPEYLKAAKPEVPEEIVGGPPEFKEPWEIPREKYIKENSENLTGDEYFITRRLADHHENLVMEAIKAGKTIPESVLKDYPELQAEGEKEAPPKPKSGTYADTGEYAAQVKSVVELPEIVEMAESLLGGKYPAIVKSMRAAGGRAVGLFIAKGTGQIKLRADIFKDSIRAAKVLAHEIGHLVDYLPSKSMAKGNILGRMASLKNYMKQSLPNKKGAPGELTPNDRAR